MPSFVGRGPGPAAWRPLGATGRRRKARHHPGRTPLGGWFRGLLPSAVATLQGSVSTLPTSLSPLSLCPL